MAAPFVDTARITVKAGNGGNGAVAFHREKYVAAGGPDGGDGGRGGNVVLVVDDNMSTLMDFRYKRKYTAPNGMDGQGGRRRGKNGENLDPVVAQERSNQIAKEWARAMEDSKNGTVRDFVAMGDVQIGVIGGDAPILESQIPVRQMLEQLIAKTGLPPFLLGLNWSTTERMSTQQADILTSELWALRRTVEPAVRKICRMYLALEGLDDRVEILWDDISLQDITEQARADLYLAQAAKYRKEAGN